MDKSTIKLPSDWKELLSEEFDKDYFISLRSFLKHEIASGKTIYPKGSLIFNAFEQTRVEKLKVVILGQDPYHGPGQAHGLSFSVPDGIKPPPSLVNIYKELNTDLGIPISSSGNLTKWAKQGVLLLNAVLTVRANEPGSHQNKGWENFTDEVIRKISETSTHLVFMLWGKFAQSKAALIDPAKHLVLQAPHPSPFSAHYGFLGCRHFSKCNAFLRAKGVHEINWQIE